MKPILSLLLLSILAACASTPQPEFGDDDEARQIYEDLVASGFLNEDKSSDFGTGLSASESAIMQSLDQLADTESESERDEVRKGLSRQLAPLGFSAVCFRTPSPGATVRYRAMHLQRAEDGPQTNQPSAHFMPLGFYQVWTERGGEATASRAKRYKITRRSQGINLEAERGDTSQLPDCSGG